MPDNQPRPNKTTPQKKASRETSNNAGSKKPKSKMVDSGNDAQVDNSNNRWTFLTNHAHVLILLSRDPHQVLREVALQVGITERAVQRIIADLEEAGFIQRERVGRQNIYRVFAERSLRHPIESHCSIGQLLELVNKPT